MGIQLSDILVENIVGKEEIAFSTMCSKTVCGLMRQNEYLWSKGLKSWTELFNFQNSFNCH